MSDYLQVICNRDIINQDRPIHIYIYALTNTYIDRFTSNQTGTCCNISNGGMVFNTLLSFRTVIHHALAKSKKKIVFFFIRVDKSGHRVTCTWLIKKNSLFEEKEGEKHNTKKSRLSLNFTYFYHFDCIFNSCIDMFLWIFKTDIFKHFKDCFRFYNRIFVQ